MAWRRRVAVVYNKISINQEIWSYLSKYYENENTQTFAAYFV